MFIFEHFLCFLLFFFFVEFNSNSISEFFDAIFELELLLKLGPFVSIFDEDGGYFFFLIVWVIPFFVRLFSTSLSDDSLSFLRLLLVVVTSVILAPLFLVSIKLLSVVPMPPNYLINRLWFSSIFCFLLSEAHFLFEDRLSSSM